MAPVPSTVARAASPTMMDLSGLKDQAKQLNPVIGYFDPLNLAQGEFWGDSNEATIGFLREAEIHYMRGGKPGYFPSFDALPHPVPFNLFDPFKLSKNASPEKKASGLLKEVNNGRLAMIGLFGFLAESKVPGSVPALTGLIKPYDGDYMAPFLPTGPDTSLWTIGNIWS